jgi:PAS domain S-box-containing protein
MRSALPWTRHAALLVFLSLLATCGLAAFLNPAPSFYTAHRSIILGTLLGLAAVLALTLAIALYLLVRKHRQLGTSTRQLADSEAYLRTILDAEPECVKIIGADGALLQMNAAGLAMIEAQDNPARVLGQKVTSLIVAEHRTAFINLTQRVLKGGSGTLEFEIVGLKGTHRWLETHAVPLKNQATGEIALLGVTRDITARKALASALLEHQLHLEEMVAKRTVDLNAARADAERMAAVKSEFLANMSHEIRTPLNAVLGLAHIGARDSAGSARETFTRIRDAGQHLLGVINDVLDFSKLDAGKLVIETRPFALGAALANAASFVTGAATQKGLTYVVSASPELPAWVHGDAQRLQQILVNLLSNAVKFTDAGEVRLRVARDGEDIYFKVIDNGIGMTPEHVARLFQPFEQADGSTTREYGGSGLGLAISRNLARLMDGDIAVDSAPGAGSSFTLRLPLPEAQADLPSHAPTALSHRLAGLHLLAAEDVEVNRLILEDLLMHEGAHVRFAENGLQAIEHLEEAGVSSFDAVLMDVQMPVMDGLEATRRIRAIAPALPVIGLTAHALGEEREKCRAAGMVEHVTKPIDADALVAAILRHAGTPGFRDEPAAGAHDGGAGGNGLFDWNVLLARYDGREAFVAKLAATVLASHRDTPAQLRAAAAAHDPEALGFAAHSLKSMAGNLMAHGVRDLARQLEAAARQGDTAIAITLAAELARATEAMLAALASHLGAQAGFTGEIADTDASSR